VEEIEITWKRVARIWWLLLWRGILGWFVLGFVVSAIVIFVMELFGKSYPDFGGAAVLVTVIFSSVLGALWALLVTRWALKKRYSGFRLVLVRD